MAATTADNDRKDEQFDTVSPLQAQAWKAANTAYHVPDGEPYRAAGIDLYQQATHERIQELLARLDAQNAYLDALLEGECREEVETAHVENEGS
jgi:hypothetical protein